jgi:hypothetical protein
LRIRLRRRYHINPAALDNNIPIYAELDPDSEKRRHAAGLILGAARNGVYRRKCLGGIDGLRLINPFATANARAIDNLPAR